MGALLETQLTGSRLGKNAVAKVPCYIQIEKRGGKRCGEGNRRKWISLENTQAVL